MLEPELGSDDGSEALARYLAGEGSPEERAAMSRWLAENPARQTEVRALEKQLQRLAFSAPADLDVDAAWRRTALRLAEMDVRPLSAAHRRRPPIAAIAAVLALVALGGFLLWQSVRSRKALARVYTTTTGRRDSITFADGGRIVLAPGSTLAAHHRPGSRPGEVTLEGEAYFEIPHDPARPFVVRTVNAEITDLGTVFTVRSAVEGAVAVQVMQGSVSLKPRRSGDSAVVLAPGDQGTLGADSRIAVTRGLPARGAPAWVEGRLEFEDAPLAEVQNQLRRWYGVELRVVDSALAGRHLTASFRDEPAPRVLEIIALTLGARVELRGDTALLRPLAGIPSNR